MLNRKLELKNIKKYMIFLYLLSVFILVCSPAHAGDETEIENLCKNGGTVQLDSKTYDIQRSFEIASNTELIGQDGTVLRFVDECGVPQNVPMISITGKQNIVIRNIRFEGNQDHQTYALKIKNPNHPEQSGKKAYGNQVGTFIYAVNSQNILVEHCAFNDNLGDGLRCSGCKNIEARYNTGEMGGHDTFFFLRSEGIKVHHNNVKTLVNSAVRLLDCSHVRVYNNIISWNGPRDAGPAVQIQHDSKPMIDVEILGNIIKSSCGPGGWVVAKPAVSGTEDVTIRWNLFENCGDNRITWVGGIISSGYDNMKIENNVFDGCYRGSVVFFAVNNAWATKATATLDSNIFTNSREGQLDGKGPYGVENTISKQEVISSQNCYYNNKAGNTVGCSVSSSDLFIDPKTSSTPSGWTWDGSQWTCKEVSPSKMGEIPDGFTPLTDEEIEEADRAAEEMEFNNIFDILDVKFTESGVSSQPIEKINYKVVREGNGKIAGGVKILGFKNMIKIDDVPYIESKESTIVVSSVIRNPVLELWSGGFTGIKKHIDVTFENDTVTAKMTVKTKWYNTKKNPVTGTRERGKIKTSTYTFNDTFSPAPKILKQPENITGTIYQYPTFFQVNVPSDGLVKIKYGYAENETEHILMTGIKNKTETGVEFTEYERIDRWKGSLEHQGNWINVLDVFDQSKLNVIAYTPYQEIKVTEFKVIKKEFPERAIARWFYPFIASLLLIFLYIKWLRSSY